MGNPALSPHREGGADCGGTQLLFFRREEVWCLLGCLRCAPPLVALHARYHPAIRFQAWIHLGGAASDAVRRFLCVDADGKAYEALVRLPAGDADRYIGLVQRIGEEGAEQFDDLRVQEGKKRGLMVSD